jgi:capsular exopolysaccharide synthesis family protein
MARTYEALLKAQKDQQITTEEPDLSDLWPDTQYPLSVNFRVPPRVAEEYHRMKHIIRNGSPGKKIKAVVFSSAKAGEGTTTVLRNFAITLASGGERVILVDGNLRNPALHNLFNLDKMSGLSDLLLGTKTLVDVMKKTDIQNLFVITSGIPHTSPSSLFESKVLDSVVGELKGQSDWVLFDSPPINIFNDATALATKMDGVIMVIEAENTRWEVAQSARERIASEKIQILGAVLNRRKMYIPEWAYRRL